MTICLHASKFLCDGAAMRRTRVNLPFTLAPECVQSAQEFTVEDGQEERDIFSIADNHASSIEYKTEHSEC